MDLRKWLRPLPRNLTADTDTPVTNTTATATVSESRDGPSANACSGRLPTDPVSAALEQPEQ